MYFVQLSQITLGTTRHVIWVILAKEDLFYTSLFQTCLKFGRSVTKSCSTTMLRHNLTQQDLQYTTKLDMMSVVLTLYSPNSTWHDSICYLAHVFWHRTVVTCLVALVGKHGATHVASGLGRLARHHVFKGVSAACTGVDMSTSLFPEVVPEIDVDLQVGPKTSKPLSRIILNRVKIHN